ncbi:flippase [Marinitoga sp. 38H-ov]|uniref:flippase n=1 Tax=Marinitoga sp. 38H-ov TaxID=1755814 RepID=UPI0013ED5BF0|nr:flippase [Marinitoga sp. 38H-ov]KAF2956271.1 hypothetical protein AS160_00300 [Marinitoga sp. 38H-ov]
MDNDYKNYLKTTAKQSSFTFLIRIVAYVLSFILQALFARYLGSQDYGLYALGFNITNIGIIFTTFGMPASMQRFLGEYLGKKETKKAQSIINAGFIIVTLTSIIAFTVLNINKHFFAINIFKKPELENTFIYFSFILIIMSYLSLFSGIFMGLKQPAKFNFQKEIVERLLRIAFFIPLFYFGYKLYGAIISTIISNIIILIILTYQFKKTKLLDFTVKPVFSELSDVLKYSVNMFFVSFTYFLLSQVNITISGMYLESSKVAIYSISSSVAGLSVFFLVSINSIFGTVISELYHTNKFETLKKLYSTVIRIVITSTIPLTLWMVLYSKEILSFFGKDYMEGYLVLSFLAIGQFVNAIVGPNGLMLSMTKHQKLELINGILIAALNISLNIFLIPKYGIVGSAIGGTVAIASINILKSVEVYIFLKIQPYDKKIIKPIISGIILIFVLLLIKNVIHSYNILFIVLMLIISYMIYLIIMRILKWNKEDLELFNALLSKIRKK